jgi:Passenger-associated-transport-repeat
MNRQCPKSNVARPCCILPPVIMVSLLTVVFTLSIQTIRADSASWSAAPASGDWNTANNWVPMTVPDGIADTATFVLSNTTGVSISANTEVNGVVFNGGASAFMITTSPTFTLTVSGVGITNNSGIAQNFVNNADASGRGKISFFNNATAGSSANVYTSNDTPSAQGTGGRTSFFDTSTAGTATFINKGNTVSGGLGGRTFFNDSSTAGNGTFIGNAGVTYQGGGGPIFFATSTAGNGAFTNNGGAASFAGGFVQFVETSTAGSATFTNNGGTVAGGTGGTTIFTESSSASNAILIANAGSGVDTGGIIFFFDDSTGDTARVEVFGNGNLDLSVHNAPGVTIGSLEGTGNVFLGARNLTVGSNNVSTTFSGVIQDGGSDPGVGGSLTKIGTGTLQLSGANIHTGPTTINAGRVMVDGSITSAVTVNNGGTLGGTGTVTGTFIVNAGGVLSGGNATTASGSLTVGNNLTLNSNSVIEVGLGAPGTHSTLSRTGGTWTFASNQAFALINLGSPLGMYDNIITGLAGDPGGTASWTVTTPGFIGTFTYDGAGNIDLTVTAGSPTPTPSPTPASQAINLSTRMRVQTGDNVGIGGFIITGTAPKHVLLRAIGPSITGLPGVLADPTLELHGTFATIINDDWMDDPVQEAAILATGLAPSNSLESAIDTTVNPGAYTAVMRGKNNTLGIGLIEVYDLSHAVPAKLANISTRAFVGTANDIVIAGFVLGNNSGNDRIVARGIGPSLTALGVANALANPTLELRNTNGALLVGNNDWQDNPAQAAELTAAGLAPTNNLESGIAATLPPGLYTALLAGQNNGTGNGLVEVYDLGRP